MTALGLPDLSEPVPDTGKVRGVCRTCAAGQGPGCRTKRVLPDGVDCAEHIRAAAVAKKLRAHFAYVKRQYNVSEARWRRMYAAQGGRCAICQVARGMTKMLGVDHDHRCCAGPKSCGKCVRGLLCTGSLSANTCNRLIAIYSREALVRAANYLMYPPALSIPEEDA